MTIQMFAVCNRMAERIHPRAQLLSCDCPALFKSVFFLLGQSKELFASKESLHIFWVSCSLALCPSPLSHRSASCSPTWGWLSGHSFSAPTYFSQGAAYGLLFTRKIYIYISNSALAVAFLKSPKYSGIWAYFCVQPSLGTTRISAPACPPLPPWCRVPIKQPPHR